MPTVLRLDGLRVMIYTDDHGPAHVHVVGPDGVLVFWLNCPGGPPTLRTKNGFGDPEARRVVAGIAERVALLCDRWREIHGHL